MPLKTTPPRRPQQMAVATMPFSLPEDCITPEGLEQIRAMYREETAMRILGGESLEQAELESDAEKGAPNTAPPPALIVRRARTESES